MKLRKLYDKDAQWMMEWLHDPMINCFYRFDAQSMTLESAEYFIAKSQEFGENRHYAIADDLDEYMGTVSLKHIDMVDKKAEYAIVIRKKYQGAGISRMATDEILKIAFEELNLHKVYLNVMKENQRANGFYKKYGFVFEGIFRKDIYVREKYYDLSWYSILKEEFEKIKEKVDKCNA